MIYLIISPKTSIEFILERIRTNNWSFIDNNGVLFVHNTLDNAEEVFRALEDDIVHLSGTTVYKLSDDEVFFYWGRANKDFWDWLQKFSQNPRSNWGAAPSSV